MLINFLIAYRAMPFFRQLINRQECTIIQHQLRTVFLQIGSANTLLVGTSFLTSLITFPDSASFNPLIETTQPFKITIQVFLKYSDQRLLQELSQFYWESLLSENDVGKLCSTFCNNLNKLSNKHVPHQPNAKLNNCQNHGLPRQLQNLLGLRVRFSFLLIEIGIKFLEINFATFSNL